MSIWNIIVLFTDMKTYESYQQCSFMCDYKLNDIIVKICDINVIQIL